jgi:hypothetical protein
MSIPNSGILIISPSGYPGSGSPLDLTQYMDVQPSDGMDPANPQFTQRVWSHALLKEGGVQALENLQLKEMQFPLNLNAGSRDAVGALLQQVNNMVNAAGQTVQWQDMGSSQPTFFDLAGGQFDIKYDFRRAGNYWICGLLRLFVQPLGHTATMRLVASAAGTGPLLMLPIPSPVLGDALAQIQAVVTSGQANVYAPIPGIAVLPPGYVPEFQSATLGGSGVLMGGSGAVASQFLRYTQPPGAPGFSQICAATLPAATPYLGTNRLIAIARGAGMLQSDIGGQTGPTSYLASITGATNSGGAGDSGWQTVDLGPFSIPSSLPQPTQLMIAVLGIAPTNALATQTIDVCDLIVLPDSNSAFVRTVGQQIATPSGAFTFDGVMNESSCEALGAFQSRLSGAQRGSIPKPPPSQQASAQLCVLFGPGSSNSIPAPANGPLSASVQVRERVRFAF